MSNFDQQNLDETQPYSAPDGNVDQPKKSWFSGCLIGCLIVGAISLVICAGVGFYAYKQGPTLMVQGSREIVKTLLDESELPEEERVAIFTEFDRVGDAFISGELNMQGLGELIQELVESPVMALPMIQAIDAKYLESSGLSEQEKAEARDTIQRVAFGVMNDKFDQFEIKSLTRHVMKNPNSTDPAEQQQLKTSLTDDELRAFLTDAKQLCDDKEIPLEDSEIRISEKLREIIDRKLP